MWDLPTGKFLENHAKLYKIELLNKKNWKRKSFSSENVPKISKNENMKFNNSINCARKPAVMRKIYSNPFKRFSHYLPF